MDVKRILIVVVAIFFAVKIISEVRTQAPVQAVAAPMAKQGNAESGASRWNRSKFATVASSDQASAKRFDSAVILPKQSDGHFYTDANVNGLGVKFLIDTGASGIALTGHDARILGLNWRDDELTMVGRGASGAVMGKVVTLGSVQVGQFQVFNVQASIIPQGLDVSLLGQSFLSQVADISIADNKMTLR